MRFNSQQSNLQIKKFKNFNSHDEFFTSSPTTTMFKGTYQRYTDFTKDIDFIMPSHQNHNRLSFSFKELIAHKNSKDRLLILNQCNLHFTSPLKYEIKDLISSISARFYMNGQFISFDGAFTNILDNLTNKNYNFHCREIGGSYCYLIPINFFFNRLITSLPLFDFMQDLITLEIHLNLDELCSDHKLLVKTFNLDLDESRVLSNTKQEYLIEKKICHQQQLINDYTCELIINDGINCDLRTMKGIFFFIEQDGDKEITNYKGVLEGELLIDGESRHKVNQITNMMHFQNMKLDKDVVPMDALWVIPLCENMFAYQPSGIETLTLNKCSLKLEFPERISGKLKVCILEYDLLTIDDGKKLLKLSFDHE